MKQVWTFLILTALVLGSVCTQAQEPQTLKSWNFQGNSGTIVMELTRAVGSGGRTATVLHIYSPDGGPRSTSEEARFLTEVLSDIEKMHIDVKSLDWMSFRLAEPEAIAKVASYAASSRNWRQGVATKRPATYYPLVASMLNESGAYKEWENVFRRYNLSIRVAGVEEVILEPFSKTQGKCPPTTNCASLRVPGDALVQMDVVPLNRQ
jgi:hypothetical protein